MRVTHKLSGFDELEKLLTELPDTVQNKVLQDATFATGRAILPDIKAAAPTHADKQSPSSKKYGTLRRNIRVARLKKVDRGAKGIRIHTGKAFWGFLLEKGTRYIAAKPWFEPAFAAVQDKAINLLGVFIGRGIEREAGKYRGKR